VSDDVSDIDAARSNTTASGRRAALAQFLPSRPHVSARDRLSVLHVVAPAAVGGIESVVRLLAASQRRRGHDVLVAPLVVDLRARAEWIESVRAAGVEVEPLVVPRRRYLAEWRAVSALLAARRPSVVHTHGYRVDVIAGHAARRLGLPTVATIHGFVARDWKHRLYEWLQRRVLRRFDAVIAVSRPMADDLRQGGVPAQRLHVVPNAYDPEDVPALGRDTARRELGLDPGAFHVGWVGRLSHEKGADVMIRALAAAPVAVRLSILGEGAERGRLEALARQLGVQDRMTWHGTRTNAARLIPAFDAVALSSRTEGTPIVLLEAMATCTPVVATRVGGVPDVVSEREAILVEPENPAAIARALETLRADPAGARLRAAAARDRLRRGFGVAAWLDGVDEVYAAALARRTSGRPG